LAMFIKLLETVSKGLFRNWSQNHCHTFLDCRHVCKTCAFHDALQAGKQKEVHRTPLIWRLQAPDQGSMVDSTHQYDIPSYCHVRVNMGASIFLFIHSHCLAAEMWTMMKNNFLGKNFWVVPSICTGFINTYCVVFPIVNFCNPGVRPV
jgi:hypothetical protein